MMEHECCGNARRFLKYQEERDSWHMLFVRDWARYGSFETEIGFCPWCGERLAIVAGIKRESQEIAAHWVEEHLGETISYRKTCLSLIGEGGLLEQLGIVEPL